MGTNVLSVSPVVDSALMMAGYAAADIASEVDSLAAPQLAALVPAVAKVIARFEAVRLAAVRAADRANVAAGSGMASTADWMAAATGEKRGKASGDVQLAGRLARLPEVAGALANGDVSKTQAATLSGAEGASAAEQRGLLDEAKTMSVNELERRVERFNRERSQPPPAVVPCVFFTQGPGGSVKADVTLDALGGEFVTTAVDAAHARMTFEKGTSLAQRRAAGLVGISRFFLENHKELHGRLGRPHVIVDIPIATLRDESGVATATLASGAVIDAATARQLACDAGISRKLTGPASEPLDVGRSTRSIPTAIARQLIIEDRHCRWPGCEAPAWTCEAHHVRPWEAPHYGETKLANIVLGCWHHHHLLHGDPGWRLELDPQTRRLDVWYRDRFIGSTYPPGRRRTGPDVAPACPSPPDPLDRFDPPDPARRLVPAAGHVHGRGSVTRRRASPAGFNGQIRRRSGDAEPAPSCHRHGGDVLDEQVVEGRVAPATLGSGAATRRQLVDRGRAVLDLAADSPLADPVAQAHHHEGRKVPLTAAVSNPFGGQLRRRAW